jgi:serine/tyrosine/threonine adenylyltransferase
VRDKQAALIASWMHVGFIHGVMNTDNMAISGETIDYGPCAFMDAYDPATVFSSIDHAGRYAYGNQPPIAQWNLARFAEALLPLIAADDSDAAGQKAVEEATPILQAFAGQYEGYLLQGLRAKLGLPEAGDDKEDAALANDWLGLMREQRVDYTLGWHGLADAASGNDAPLEALFGDVGALRPWLARWRQRCARESQASGARADAMRRINPWIIPRNHRVEEALLAASEHDDIAPFERLLSALQSAYAQTPGNAAFAEPAPAAMTAGYQTFCGT